MEKSLSMAGTAPGTWARTRSSARISTPAGRERGRQAGQEFGRHAGVHEDRLDRVAHAEAVRLGVDRQLVRHGEVGRTVDVDVAVPVAVEDVGHGGVLDERRDQRLARRAGSGSR